MSFWGTGILQTETEGSVAEENGGVGAEVWLGGLGVLVGVGG